MVSIYCVLRVMGARLQPGVTGCPYGSTMNFLAIQALDCCWFMAIICLHHRSHSTILKERYKIRVISTQQSRGSARCLARQHIRDMRMIIAARHYVSLLFRNYSHRNSNSYVSAVSINFKIHRSLTFLRWLPMSCCVSESNTRKSLCYT